MNFKNIIAGLEAAASMAEKLVPEIAALTPYGAIATTIVNAVGAATEVADKLQSSIADGTLVASSTDQAQVRDLAQKLHDHNDELSKLIDES